MTENYKNLKDLSEIYGIPLLTIRSWVKSNYFKDIIKIKNKLYISEKEFLKVMDFRQGRTYIANAYDNTKRF